MEICGIKVYGYDNVGTSIPAVDNSGVQVVDYGTAISIDIDFENNIWISNDKGFVYKQDHSSNKWTKIEDLEHVS